MSRIPQYDIEFSFVYLFASCLHIFAYSSKTRMSGTVHTYQLGSHTILLGDMVEFSKRLVRFLKVVLVLQR